MKSEVIGRVCVFCGSNSGTRRVYEDAARALARLLAARQIDLVYGGGCVGLMGIVADEMLSLGRDVIGVIPRALAEREVAHLLVKDLRIVRTMHERKSLMAELSDAFIALPGGFGTFEELFEIITWAQLGIHQKPIGVLNVEGYFDPLITMIANAVMEGFIRPEYRDLIIVSDNVDDLLVRVEQFKPVDSVTKWVDLVET
ncbi:MAG: TIGR00730 family Rossman fold protein [Acidobacteriota bacterium]